MVTSNGFVVVPEYINYEGGKTEKNNMQINYSKLNWSLFNSTDSESITMNPPRLFID